MRIAVIGIPRSGSTIICQMVASLFNLTNLDEDIEFTDTPEICYKKIANYYVEDDFVVKLISSSFMRIPISSVDWSCFDFIITLTRQSIVDAYLSHEYVTQTGNSQRIVDSNEAWKSTSFFALGDASILFWYNQNVLKFLDMQDLINATVNKPMIVTIPFEALGNEKELPLYLEQMFNKKFESINRVVIPTGNNYAEQCLNYEEIVLQFKEFGFV